MLTQPEGRLPGWREAISQRCPHPKGGNSFAFRCLSDCNPAASRKPGASSHLFPLCPNTWETTNAHALEVFLASYTTVRPGHTGQLTLWVMKVTASTPPPRPVGLPSRLHSCVVLPQPGTVFPFSSPSPLRTHQKCILNPGSPRTPDLRPPSCAVPGALLSPSLGDPEVLHTFLAHPTSLPNMLPSEPRTPGALGLRLWQLLPTLYPDSPALLQSRLKVTSSRRLSLAPKTRTKQPDVRPMAPDLLLISVQCPSPQRPGSCVSRAPGSAGCILSR